MKKIICSLFVLPAIALALPGFHVNNTTDLSFSTKIGDQSGLKIAAGKEINVPFGPMYSKCHKSKQLDKCLLNIYDTSNDSLVATIPFDPKSMTVVSAPEIKGPYNNIQFDGWDTYPRVESITIYQQ